MKGSHAGKRLMKVKGFTEVNGLTEVSFIINMVAVKKLLIPCSPTFKIMAPPLNIVTLLQVQCVLELKRGGRKGMGEGI